MPRKARVLVPEHPHHIVQRGHNRNAAFLTDRDYQYYLNNLNEWKQKLGIEIYAWCLMTNHVHIVAQPGKNTAALSEMMKRVNGRHTAYMNKLESRSGSLWEGRFKASPIQEERYLLRCCRYVELKPVVAGMVPAAEDYAWSSYRERMSGIAHGMLDRCDCFEAPGRIHAERRENYREYLSYAGSIRERRFIDDSVKRNRLTGNHR